MNTFYVEKNGLKRNDWSAIKNFHSYNMPILYLSGSMAGISKDDKVTLNYLYQDKAGTCTLKWQGSSSVNLPKKNYTITFDNAFEVVSGWGIQKKYCLKANFVDSSHARNIVCAKLWGQIVKSRTPSNATLNALPNGGAVDGFPIIISLNGKFHGLYTWNIPKDAWMFGMDGTGHQAIVCAELNNNGAVAFDGLATLKEDADGQLDFDLEYSSNDESEWVVESLNRLLSAVKDSDGTNITNGITPYLDWESAIDYFIHACLTSNYDGIFRNYLLSTYDGVKWFFTGYDMDVVLGLRAMGKYFYPANHHAVSFATMASQHKLFRLIWKYMRPQLRARYNELRASVMSVENVANMFVDFTADIDMPVYIDDWRRWNTVPSTSANNLSQIISYYDLRCRNADEWIKSTEGETEMPEQENPDGYTNQVPISIDTDGTIFNGKGWIGKKRLTSSGEIKESDYTSVTGYMPASSDANVYIKGVLWNGGADYICTYKSDFTFLTALNGQGSYGGGEVISRGNNLTQVKLPNNSDIAYIRVSAKFNDTDDGATSITDIIEGPGSYLIVTVNEEIT